MHKRYTYTHSLLIIHISGSLMFNCHTMSYHLYRLNFTFMCTEWTNYSRKRINTITIHFYHSIHRTKMVVTVTMMTMMSNKTVTIATTVELPESDVIPAYIHTNIILYVTYVCKTLQGTNVLVHTDQQIMKLCKELIIITRSGKTLPMQSYLQKD